MFESCYSIFKIWFGFGNETRLSQLREKETLFRFYLEEIVPSPLRNVVLFPTHNTRPT